MKEVDLWEFVKVKLGNNIKVILLVVAESSNSSPGKAGFKMACSMDGDLIGTIGGGIMESQLLNEAMKYLESGEKVSAVKKLFHNKNARRNKSGLICGGTQTMIIKSIENEDLINIEMILEKIKKLERGLLVINQEGISFREDSIMSTRYNFSYTSEKLWQYKENSGFTDTVYIIGGGHVGLAVSKVMSVLDFYVVVFDPRKDVFTMLNNTYADKKIHIPYDKVGDYIVEGDRSYAVVVTSEHDSDLMSLKAVIQKKLKYIGLMGSKAKIKSIFKGLTEAGIGSELIDKVNTPIGIEINAESPDEIAVSIAAEIIKIKNSIS